MSRPVAVAFATLSLTAAAMSPALASTTAASTAPSRAATRADERPIISSSKTKSTKRSDRIAMTTEVLPNSTVANRALGAAYQQRIAVSFVGTGSGGLTLGIVRGIVDTTTGDADLQFVSSNETSEGGRSGPYAVRVRSGRMQVAVPNDLKTRIGFDGYVTSLNEASVLGVGLENEALLAIAVLEAVNLPWEVADWKSAKTAKSTATGAAKTLTGSAKRPSFAVFSREQYGATARVDLNVKGNGKIESLTFGYTPLAKAKAAGRATITLRGTVVPSTKELREFAPAGKFITASRLFELDPVPEIPRQLADAVDQATA